MIVTFTARHGPDIVMFGHIAKQLLRMMGHSGTVPGAIRPEDLPAMHAQLTAALARLDPEDTGEGEPARGSGERSVPLRVRAGPLVALLETAMEHDDHVMWQ